MEALLILLGLYWDLNQCNAATMRDGFGRECVEVVEIYTPRKNILPSRFGPIPMGLICDEGVLIDGHCEKRYLAAIKR